MIPFMPSQRLVDFFLPHKTWPPQAGWARNSFVDLFGISLQIGTGKCSNFPLQLKLAPDLIPAKSHIWMVRVSIYSSLSGIRMLIATCSNYLLSAALNISSIKDKLQYLNCLLPVVFQRKKKIQISLQIVCY